MDLFLTWELGKRFSLEHLRTVQALIYSLAPLK